MFEAVIQNAKVEDNLFLVFLIGATMQDGG